MIDSKGQTYNRIVVLDTSFLIDYSEGHHWTLEPFNLINQPDSMVVIPQDVEYEYARLIGNTTHSQDPNDKPRNIFELLKLRRYATYTEALRKALAEKLDHKIEYLNQRHSSLSRTDKTLVQAAYDIAREGEEVSVVSGDRGIIDQVENLNLEYHLNIDRHSPHQTAILKSKSEFVFSPD